MDTPEQVRQKIADGFIIEYNDKLYTVRNKNHRYPERFTTKARAEEFIESRIANKINEICGSLAWDMRNRHLTIKQRTRIWKRICRLKSLI